MDLIMSLFLRLFLRLGALFAPQAALRPVPAPVRRQRPRLPADPQG